MAYFISPFFFINRISIAGIRKFHNIFPQAAERKNSRRLHMAVCCSVHPSAGFSASSR